MRKPYCETCRKLIHLSAAQLKELSARDIENISECEGCYKKRHEQAALDGVGAFTDWC